MRNLIFLFVPFAAILLISTGCEPARPTPTQIVTQTPPECQTLSAYHPVKAVFLPLTEITPAAQPDQTDTITAYIALQDSAGSAVKAPAVFRFELYEFTPLSTDPKGRRLHIWDDIYLTDFSENSRYWRDFLRAYEFRLDYDCAAATKYVLELTCLPPSGARLLAELVLQKD